MKTGSFRFSWLGLFVMCGVSFSGSVRAEGNTSLGADLGLQVHPLIQAWALNDTTSAPWINFRVRRAQLDLEGELQQTVHWFFSVDAAKLITVGSAGTLTPKSDNNILQDVGGTIHLVGKFDLTLGQYRIPASYLGSRPYGELLFPEMSVLARTYGNRRDPGVSVSYGDKEFSARAMISNGKGPNADDTNRSKDLTMRSDLALSKNMSVGAYVSMMDLSFDTASFGGLNFTVREDQWEMTLEGAIANTSGSLGFAGVLEGGYFVTERLQPIARVELIQPNRDAGDLANAFSLGANFILVPQKAKLQGMVSSTYNMSSFRGVTEYASGLPRLTLVLISLQITP